MTNFGTSNAILTIDLEALANNYRLLQERIGGNSALSGILKANAYGTGLQEVASKLKQLGCPQFFVATLDEALKLRRLDKKTPIAVLGDLMNGAQNEYLEHSLLPVLNTPSDIARWQALAHKTEQKLSAIIHFDTGMHRLGLSSIETRTIVENKESLNGLDVQMLISHFACADEKDHPLTQKQADDFAALAQYFPKAKKSLANSSGIFRNSSYHYDMVRPGYALYGGNPTPETQNPMQSVISLNTRILQIRDCQKGESIGYSATHIFDKETRTATVALGYADGFLRSNSSKAVLYFKNQPCPVLGRVSMDLVSIDISNLQGKPPEQGDTVEILGKNQSIDDLANNAGTIGYEILTSLGNRYKRDYL